MNWKNLFNPVENMTAAEAKEFMAQHSTGDFQLLDVRQPKEYESGHLPGSLFIPLRELPTRLDELDKEKPVIAYCAVGGRSRAAAQLLAGKGFGRVYNLAGGIKAWQGRKAAGPEERGLELLTGGEDYSDAVSLAYAMEDGLQTFYRKLAETAESETERKLYQRLANFEVTHKARLMEEYREHAGDNAVSRPAGIENSARIMEGGGRVDDFLEQVRPYLKNVVDILELAMMLETQAYDLYSRMARKSGRATARELFLRLADEETMHLGFLAEELDKTLSEYH